MSNKFLRYHHLTKKKNFGLQCYRSNDVQCKTKESLQVHQCIQHSGSSSLDNFLSKECWNDLWAQFRAVTDKAEDVSCRPSHAIEFDNWNLI